LLAGHFNYCKNNTIVWRKLSAFCNIYRYLRFNV